jgi:hypothetical protein
MDHLSQQLEATMIEPIRKAAVEKVSGPQILQVRRFNTAASTSSKIVGREFVFPLLGRWWIHQKD